MGILALDSMGNFVETGGFGQGQDRPKRPVYSDEKVLTVNPTDCNNLSKAVRTEASSSTTQTDGSAVFIRWLPYR